MPGTGSIGEELRRKREQLGLSIEEVSSRTRITLRALHAIERNSFEQLPGLVFTRNFIRLYGNELGLDGDDLASRLPRVDIESQPMPNPPPKPGGIPWDPRVTAALASVAWLVTAAGAVTGAWYFYNHYGHTLLKSVASTPAPPKSAPSAPAPVASIPPVASSPSTAASVENTNTPAVQTSAGANEFDASRPVQVVLTAHEAAWVQISTDERKAFVGMLHPNERKEVAADDSVRILTGNAGGVDISLNGKQLEPIGPKGQVRTVSLTAQGPKLVAPTPQAPQQSSGL